ncbi:cation-transporting P-type ATPase [Patescibacteria group bacterium]|nr:cation-transporting P-type ATPase [Patescibacteria group bacterium]
MDKFAAGLSEEEALAKLGQFGPNEIKDYSQTTAIKILLNLVKKNFILYLLSVGAIISFFVQETVTGLTILLVLAIIIIVSFIQEFRAEKAIKALRKMVVQASIVIRQRREQEIPSRNLVPGDLLVLRSGERVPADAIVIEQNNLSVDESILTGESKEVKKTATKNSNDPQEENIVFMGSYVVEGRCKVQVLHTGMNTKFGAIANMISETEKSLPLQDKVNKLAGVMVVAAVVISLLTGIVMAARVDVWTIDKISSILILIIALCVSAFPEGLPVVLVTTLAVGATRMAKKNAIVNRMSTIETLGETTVICSDKTGTITRGEMTVKKIWLNGQLTEVGGVGYEAKGAFTLEGTSHQFSLTEQVFERFLESAILCNDSKINRTGEDELYNVIGTPTEGALLIMAAKADKFMEDYSVKRLEEIPFDSERKMMSVLCQVGERYFVFAKGAPEILLKKCSRIQKKQQPLALNNSQKDDVLEVNSNLTQQTYRTIAMAFKEIKAPSKNYSEEGLTFLGLAAMEDPPREEIAESLELCHEAGIRVIMITGDNSQTAQAVAKNIGLFGDVLEGSDLDKLTDDELSKIIGNTAIFARVRPDHKMRIVRVLKSMGEIVTMTGDGINDAPALKEAHIGVAMGRTGTDVSRSVADLTLKDDNFATIVEAIKEGRTIFHNIRKFVSYQLACNWAELLILFLGVLISPLLGWQVPVLLALQILFMNLVTDDLPAIMLGLNRSSRDVMQEPPRRNAGILNPYITFYMGMTTVLITIFTLTTFYIFFNFLHRDLLTARTAAMLGLIILEVISAFNFRSFKGPVLDRSILSNTYLFWAATISILVTIMVLYVPFFNQVFEVVGVDLFTWAFVVFLSFVLILIFDKYKQKERGVPLLN